MSFEIVVLPGDGIGPEVTAAAVAVLKSIGHKHGHDFRFSTQLMGGAAIDATGEPLPAELPNLRYLGVGPLPAQIIKDIPATAELLKLV